LILLSKVGYPTLALYAALVVDVDFEKIREKRGVTDDISGKFIRNECFYLFQGICKPKGHKGQVQMVPWFAEALRWAHPWGHYEGYEINMPKEVEDEFAPGGEARMIMQADLDAWCEILTAAELPPIATPVIDWS
jgi:hypothetical protein